MIRVLLADDHALVRAGIHSLLQGMRDVQVIAEASSGEEALELADRQPPDVVLMDIAMKGITGLEAAAQMRERHPDVRVVILSMHSGEEYVLQALRAGAVGYLLKDAEPDDILGGIRAVARGESPIHPRAARELLHTRRPAADMPDLTPREREVLGLVREGLANKQIARRLGITERTVKAHLTSIFATIGVADRTSAALWAERHRV
jgi:DNA-binding NarL/FixJ family response regulator